MPILRPMQPLKSPIRTHHAASGGSALPVAGATLWLDASTLALTNGANVTTWPDSSGSGNNGTAGGSAIPTFVSGALNGKGGVNFVFTGSPGGTSTTYGYFTFPTFVYPQPFTVLFVGQIDTTKTVQSEIFDSLPGSRVFFSLVSVAVSHSYIYAGSSLLMSDMPNPITPLAWVGVFNGASSIIGHNGTETTGSIGTAGLNGMILGAYTTSTAIESWAGNIYEFVFFPSALNPTDRATMVAYLRSKWAV
jgi:hypothetical protein